MPEASSFKKIKELVISLDHDGVIQATRDALDQGLEARDIIAGGLSKGMEVIGDKFESREFFLPELMISAKIMKAALEILNPFLEKGSDASAGKIVLGTVEGDIHFIGKSIVGAVLEGEGYEVYDLGEDVPPMEFVKKAEEVGADVVGISALISIAVSKMAETISLLKERNIKAAVIVGGAAVTPGAVETIRADAYGQDAWAALKAVRQLLKKEG